MPQYLSVSRPPRNQVCSGILVDELSVNRKLSVFVESTLIANSTQSPPTIPLRPVLNLRLLYRLPLHVGRNISTATFERSDVIDNVALAPLRIAAPLHEFISRGSTPFDFALSIALSDCRFLWN
jgi:hypothetical protein